jgi:hypothetical protein
MFHRGVFAPREHLIAHRLLKNFGIGEGPKTNGLVRLKARYSLDSKEQAAVSTTEDLMTEPVWRWECRAWGHKIRAAPHGVLNKTDTLH